MLLLFGSQLGYTKYMCFLCLCDSENGTNHFKKKAVKSCENLAVGTFDLKHTPPVNLENILLAPLNMKMESIKIFDKAIIMTALHSRI